MATFESYDFTEETDLDGHHLHCVNPRTVRMFDQDSLTIYTLRVPCGSRFDSQCPFCARRYHRKVKKRFLKGIQAMRHPIFLTLTLRYDKQTLEGSLMYRDKPILACRKELFRALVDEGYRIDSWCASLEPPNHLHLVIDSSYIPREVIQRLWKQITNGSWAVDIREVNDAGIAHYVSKYVTKPQKWERYFSMDQLKGKHLVESHALLDRPLRPSHPWDGSILLSWDDWLIMKDMSDDELRAWSPSLPTGPPYRQVTFDGLSPSCSRCTSHRATCERAHCPHLLPLSPAC